MKFGCKFMNVRFFDEEGRACVPSHRTVTLGHAGAEDIAKAIVHCFEEADIPWENLIQTMSDSPNVM